MSAPSLRDGRVSLAPWPCFEGLKGGQATGAFGADWSASKLAGLLAEAGHAGKSLDDWLRDGFFAQHCELFHQRPFIWHNRDRKAGSLPSARLVLW
jgi:hypothetical protein